MFSTNKPFGSVLATKASYSKLAAYTTPEHNGDFAAAARALAAQGYGEPTRDPLWSHDYGPQRTRAYWMPASRV